MPIDAVSGISSGASQTAQTQSTPFAQLRNDFAALGNALQAGDVAAAQSAFATYQQDLDTVQQIRAARQAQPPTQGSSSSFDDVLKALSQALSSGDLAGAQQAYQSLQQQVASGHGHHHHHHAGTAAAPSSTAPTGNAPGSGGVDVLA